MELDTSEESQLHIGGGQHLIVKTQYIVTAKEELKLYTGNGDFCGLDITISADFQNIPTEYHHIFINMMTARYGGVVNCYDNTGDQLFLVPLSKPKKWWEFWKNK